MRILLVDDEPAIADTLAYALTTEGFQTHWCGLGQEALASAKDNDYALIILDVGLPDLSGFDVCRQLRRFSDVPVIFLTARSEEVDRIVGLELGADDFVSKPFSPREVAARVRAILRRARSKAEPATKPQRWFEVDKEGLRIEFCNQPLALTRYEFHLLSLLLEHPGRVLSRAHLMASVWQDAEETLDRTVDAHIKTLRAKLRGVRDDLDPIETHRGLGYSARNEAL